MRHFYYCVKVSPHFISLDSSMFLFSSTWWSWYRTRKKMYWKEKNRAETFCFIHNLINCNFCCSESLFCFLPIFRWHEIKNFSSHWTFTLLICWNVSPFSWLQPLTRPYLNMKIEMNLTAELLFLIRRKICVIFNETNRQLTSPDTTFSINIM